MIDSILGNETFIRLGFFFGVFFAVGLWEVVAPRRRLVMSKTVRWASNLGIVVLNSVVVRLIFGGAAVGLAVAAERNGWGIFNNLSVPGWLAVVVSVIVLDLVIYLQHVMFHAIPVFWRMHLMHHADLDIDVTTGARFHPFEIVLSMIIKLAAVMMLGPAAVAVVIFEVILNATAMFNHGNVRMPKGLDRVLRWIVVTPDMHRVHHSHLARETNSNFGFNLPWWDRLFGTYRSQPAEGHEAMTIGLDQFTDPKRNNLLRMLIQPFVSPSGDHTIDKRW